MITAPRRRVLQARLHKTRPQYGERRGVQVRGELSALGRVIRVALCKKRVVQARLSLYGMTGRYPVYGPFHLAAVRRVAAARSRVIGAVYLFYLPRSFIPANACALYKIGVAQADLAARRQAKELFRRLLAEIILFDINLL